MLIIVAATSIIYFHRNSEGGGATLNEGVLSRGSFYVIHDEMGTYANGSYFIIGNGNDFTMKVISKITVGPEDFGGISFNFPSGFKVMGITCDYGTGNISDHITLWTTGSTISDIRSYVEIDKAIGTQPLGGGTGMIEIELKLDKGFEESYFIVGVGSEISESGTTIINPITEKIEVGVN